MSKVESRISMKINVKKTIFVVGLIGVVLMAVLALMYYRVGFVSNPANRATITEVTTPVGYTRVPCEEGSLGAVI